MDNTTIGDRMKDYEKTFSFKYPIRLPLVLRFDGVHFHSMVKKWKCKKPFDDRLVSAMQETALGLCKAIAGAQIAYVQSDEITILIRDDMTNQTQPMFDKKINKIISVFASKASNLFNYHFFKNEADVPFEHLAEFDCRGWVMPENEIINTFIWRQIDCTRNSIQMLGRAYFSHKELHVKSCNDIQEMLWSQHDINFNDIPTHLKRGTCVIKMDKKVPIKKFENGELIDSNETTTRKVWSIDNEIPIFTKDKNYINKYTHINN